MNVWHEWYEGGWQRNEMKQRRWVDTGDILGEFLLMIAPCEGNIKFTYLSVFSLI